MGRFDWVRCEYPLPVEAHRLVGTWQTTSVAQPNMRHLTVTADGRLLVHGLEVEPPFESVIELLELNEDETERWRYWLTFRAGRVVDVRGETQPGLSPDYEEVELLPADEDAEAAE